MQWHWVSCCSGTLEWDHPKDGLKLGVAFHQGCHYDELQAAWFKKKKKKNHPIVVSLVKQYWWDSTACQRMYFNGRLNKIQDYPIVDGMNIILNHCGLETSYGIRDFGHQYSSHGLPPIRCQAMTLTNTDLFYPTDTFSWDFILECFEIFSFKKIHLKLLSVNFWAFCSGLMWQNNK